MIVGGLLAHPMRSLLTTLGILIGTAAVIFLVAVTSGVAQGVHQGITTLGSQAIYVFPINRGLAQDQDRLGTRIRPVRLTPDDVRALRDHSLAPDISAVAPGVAATKVTATWGGVTYPVADFTGIGPAFQEIGHYTMARGRFHNDQEEASHARVAVVGATVADHLFGTGVDPVGQPISLNGVRFRVVGLTAHERDVGFGDPGDSVMVPLSAAIDHVVGPVDTYTVIAVQAASTGQVAAAQAETDAILRRNHGLAPEGDADFAVFTSAALIAAGRSATDAFTRMLIAVAGISLLVGGVGIMNIMLVIVTERTSEIGLRRALGAHRAHIVRQFLFEAVVLSSLGGGFGVLLGVGAAHVHVASVTPVVSPLTVLVAFGLSTLTGVVFGAYPASRAARMKPYEALCYQ
jgi:putative ABC transport system permease protein